MEKTRELCKERITFLENGLKAMLGYEQKEKFKIVKNHREALLKAIDNNQNIQYYAKQAINPLLKFQEKMQKSLIDGYENTKKIQNNLYEDSVKMTDADFYKYTKNYEFILQNYNNDINNIKLCLKECMRNTKNQKTNTNN